MSMCADSALGARILELAGRLGVDPTPETYALFYRYLSKSDDKLCEALDAALARPILPSQLDLDRIWRQFGNAGDGQRLTSLYDASQIQLQRLSLYVESAGDDARQYRDALNEGNDYLQATDDVVTQRELLSRLIEATSAMIEKTQRLESQVAIASREIQALRNDLEQARAESRTDPLTGLPNRKAFQSYLEIHSARAIADRKPLSLLFCDIDRFKQFNDTWGHRLGDEVLKLVGNSLEQLCQGIGFPARYGGEEFVIVLPNRDTRAATDIAEQIRDFVGSRTLRVKNMNRTVGQVTLSLGISQLRWQDSLDDLIERADAALYLAKETGRNRVCTEADTTSVAKLAASAG